LQWKNLRIVLLALFGLVAGQAVVWYTGQFYALFFLTQTLKIDGQSANLMIAAALLLATPFFIVFGRLSDRVGRKPIIMLGLLLACLTYFPIFQAITHYGNPALQEAIEASPVLVSADPAECSLQFNPVGTSKFTSSCDVAKSTLVRRGVPYQNVAAAAGATATVSVGGTEIVFGAPVSEPAPNANERAPTSADAFAAELGAALDAASYPAVADPARINTPMLVLLLWILVLYVTMVYAPIAAMLVELFPTRIRYTSMSLPYHIGNGWFGGFLPPTAFAIVAATGNMHSGLWYPIVVAGASFVIGTLFIRETKDIDIYAKD
ncbi:MAG TPA: MFS transporter, partial [Halioglobus sp.]